MAKARSKPPRPPASLKAATPFWREKSLEALSPEEWESLCDGCGRCCLLKLEDEDTGEIHYTDIGCALLDAGTCRCRDYKRRQLRVPDCVRLTPEAVRTLPWLPPTCGYRLVRDGHDLPWWHPLVSGTRRTVHEAGISVYGRVSGTEEEFETDEMPDRIVDWPGQDPGSQDPRSQGPQGQDPQGQDPQDQDPQNQDSESRDPGCEDPKAGA